MKRDDWMDLEKNRERKKKRIEPIQKYQTLLRHAISGRHYDHFCQGQKKGREEHKNRQMDKE